MKWFLFSLIFLSPLMASEPKYECRFYVREKLLEAGEVSTKEFEGEPMEINLRSYVAKIKPVIVEGRDTLALWVGNEKKENSAVSLFDMGYPRPYVNIILNGVFLETKCALK